MAPAVPRPAPRPGPRNLITDVAGLRVGQAHDEALRTGVTVLVCPGLIPASVDVRGGGPGTRETEALAAENSVGAGDAVVLSGGSALGLGAADAVAAALSAQGRGVRVAEGHPTVPIVPAAILYDLGPHLAAAFAAEGPPHPRLARAALAAAGPDFALGSVGAGRGANAGVLKGGVGSTSTVLAGLAGDGPVTVGALAAVNPVGSVVMPGSRAFWAWPFEQVIDGRPEFGGLRPDPAAPPAAEPFPAESRLAARRPPPPGAATAIAVVATDADLSAAECRRFAMMAQDGFARAIRPAHTPFDGDTVFAVATGAAALGAGPGRALRLAALGAAAADALARAVARGAFEAVSAPGDRPAWRDLGPA